MTTNQEQPKAERTNRRKQCQKCGRDLLSSKCSIDTCRFAQETMEKARELIEFIDQIHRLEYGGDNLLLTLGRELDNRKVDILQVAQFCEQLHKDLEIARKENEIMREGLGEFDDLSWVKKIFKVLEAIK